MATFEQISRFALTLPETNESESRGNRHWDIRKKTFIWERPRRKNELAALGPKAETGPILGVRVVDLEDKAAILEQDPKIFFTTPHFDNYPAVLVRLNKATITQLKGLITEAWLDRAPKKLAEEFLKNRKLAAQGVNVTL